MRQKTFKSNELHIGKLREIMPANHALHTKAATLTSAELSRSPDCGLCSNVADYGEFNLRVIIASDIIDERRGVLLHEKYIYLNRSFIGFAERLFQPLFYSFVSFLNSDVKWNPISGFCSI